MSDALSKLSPEMQARLAQIMAGQQPQAESPHQAAIPQQTAPTPPPVVKPPSLMDHVIALRGEVQALRQQVAANSDVVDAVGQAVGQLYQMFQPSPELPTQSPPTGPTYSETFQQQVNTEDF